MRRKKNRLEAQQYIEGILQHDRYILSRAITVVESNLKSDKKLSQEIIESIMPYTGKSLRIGITGVPGVGKSTFIECFGKLLTSQHKKIAILAIDPSSQLSRGSILGDKTRMESLAHDSLAYIRPSPAGKSLGGVGYKTRETMLLCEAAGFEVILIETVGVGQSETLVRSMVDCFLLLMLAGAGDELQGIKRGIMEMADILTITKADSANLANAKRAKNQYKNALHLLPPSHSNWIPQVATCSALENENIDGIWDLIKKYQDFTQQNGFFEQNRQNQNLHWLHEAIQQGLQAAFYNHDDIKKQLTTIESLVSEGKKAPLKAAEELLTIFKTKI
jgi:LAO/AO transport system kinase